MKETQVNLRYKMCLPKAWPCRSPVPKQEDMWAWANTWNNRGPGQTKNRSKPNQIHLNTSQIAKIKLFWINHSHKETCAQTKGTVSKPNQNWNNIVAQECTLWGFWSKA